MEHNLPLFCVGASLIWFGWYGFNGASAYKASFDAGIAILNTHIGACTSGVVWSFLAYFRENRFHLVEIISGSLAGLAGVKIELLYFINFNKFSFIY